MRLLVFSDLDGTFLDHNSYSFGNLKSYLREIKNKTFLIFNTSKTFSEILYLNRSLDLNNPFIVENGACIFFPSGYLDSLELNSNYFKHRGYLGYKLAIDNLEKFNQDLYLLKKNYKFQFYNELSNRKISEITNLSINEVKRSKERLFTNPIRWNDSMDKIPSFKSDVISIFGDCKIYEGGRFIHILKNYDKGKALRKFIEIIKPSLNYNFITVSLGDSENDICMLESTDYSCIVKAEKNKISLKKKNNIYFSKTKAPNGWQESLENVFRMEDKNI